MKWLFTAAVASILSTSAFAADNILLPTPPMGWNSWNTFHEKIDEKLIEGVADAMLKNGMKDAGYIYVNLDDCWSEKERTADGELVGDHKRFPKGMKALGDYLHERGFKFGIYNCCGTQTCAGYPGTKGHEEQDMKTYASWGVDYIKMDWCHTEGMNQPEAYHKIHDAIKGTGRPMVLSICEWGGSKPWVWAKGVGDLWRTTGDIGPIYEGHDKSNQAGWKTILDANVQLAEFAGPGHWNDPDMLEVGVGELTAAESKSHFSFWCMLAAPLIARNDVRSMTEETRAVLTDKDVIAINQDALGKQATRVIANDDREVWVKELSGGEKAVILLNKHKDSANVELKWSDVSSLNGNYAVRDLWNKKDLGTTESNFTGSLDGHGVALFRLKPAP